MANPYDQTAADLFSGVLASGAQSSVTSVADRNPDQEAENQRRAAQLGIPADSVRANPKIVQQRVAGQSVDWQNMARTAPRTTRFLNDTSHAAIAHDDIGVLGTIENLVRGATALANPVRLAEQIGHAIGQRITEGTQQDIQRLGGRGNYFRNLTADRSPQNTLAELGSGLAQMDEGISGAIEAVGNTLGSDYIAKTAANDRAAAIRLQQRWQPTYATQLGGDIGMGVEAFCLDVRQLADILSGY